jgi:GMP synthase (glutamine-hydrolysing)
MKSLFQRYFQSLQEAHGEAVWSKLSVVDLCIANTVTTVKLSNGHCGLALNFDLVGHQPKLTPDLSETLRGRLLERARQEPLLTETLFQQNEGPTFRSLSVALLNALSQSLLTAQHLTPKGSKVLPGRMPIHRLEGLGSKALVIGCGGYLEDVLNAPFITEVVCSDLAFKIPEAMEHYGPYLEDVVFPYRDHKKVEISDGSDNAALISNCELLFITGSTLVNDTLPDILKWAGHKAAVVLEGNTAGLYPFPLFEQGVTHLVQTVIDLDFVTLSRRYARQRTEGHIHMDSAQYTETLLPEMRTLERLPTFDIKRQRGGRDKKILLLQARDWDDPMIAHEIHCFRERVPDEFEIACYNIVNGPWDEDVLAGYDAIMVGGSGAYGAAENHNPWFEPSLAFLRRVVALGIPLFCSCWGHEALAVALGGRVHYDENGYELGILELELSQAGKEDQLFGQLPSFFKAPLGHSEQVVELPPNSIVLASTQRCAVQAFRLKDKPVYSCQFHPELSSARLWERVEAYIPHLREEVGDDAQACTDHLIAEFLRLYT